MSAGFEPPRGDPAALRAAVTGLRAVLADLEGQESRLKAATHTAVAEWRAPRAETFRHVTAGLQVLVVSAGTALQQAAEALAKYAEALEAAQARVRELATEAGEAQAAAQTQASRLPADSSQVDLIRQRATQRRAFLEDQAQAVHDDLAQQALRAAAALDAVAENGLAGAAGMNPAEIARRVDASMGVAGLAGAARSGQLSQEQAWSVLGPVQQAVPGGGATAEGDPVWGLLKDAVDWTTNSWTMLTAPPAGWAFYRLAQNVYDTYLTKQAALAAADQLVARARAGESVIRIAHQLEDLGETWSAVDPGRQRPLLMSKAVGGGMPEAGALGVAGRVFLIGGLATDVNTFMNPGGRTETEHNLDRAAAAANAAATVTVLATAGSVGWVPVAGQVVLLGTGLYLTYSWARDSYREGGWAKTAVDSTSDFVTDTVPDAFSDGAGAVRRWAGELVG